MENLYKLNIQLFNNNENDPEPNKELEQLLNDLGSQDPKPADQDPKPEEPSQEPKPEKTPDPEPSEPSQDPKPADTDPEQETKGGIAELRKKQKEDAKRLKELEQEKENFEKESKSKQERLIKAIRFGIKGETEEEILENLTSYEVKQEAETKGLTEEQIRAQKDLEERMKNLTQKEQEVVFNSRIFGMQQSLNLTQDDVMEFIKVAGETGINLFTNSVDFKTIYERIMPKPSAEVANNQELLDKIATLEKELEEYRDNRAPGKGAKGKGEPSNLSWLDMIEQAKGPNEK